MCKVIEHGTGNVHTGVNSSKNIGPVFFLFSVYNKLVSSGGTTNLSNYNKLVSKTWY